MTKHDEEEVRRRTGDEYEVLQHVRENLGTGAETKTTLRTDSRVLARITDGIYRSPSSAIRELVANAYDADASSVTIETNPPWFDRIVVRDDGEGMDETALVRLIKHIGGSSKRTLIGRGIGTTGEDPYLSPGGRRLIGRIGIGLFSVAQLTRHFRIVTKRSDTNVRLFADVVLDSYNEDELADKEAEGPDPVSTGRVIIQSYYADDTASHGTDIVLTELRQEALNLLRSQDDREAQGEGDLALPKFTYHIGTPAPPGEGFTYAEKPRLPWSDCDEPLERFRKLYQGVADWSGTQKSKLEVILDRYLQTMWKLALSVPLDYIDDVHPFDLTSDAEPRVFHLSNDRRGLATELELQPGQTIRQALSLRAPEKGSTPFRVVMDGVELRRPIRFSSVGARGKPQERPLLFVGSWTPRLDEIPATTSGGRELSFEGYMLWMRCIIPAEHAGLLTRIADACGMPPDQGFMDYSVAEMTRLRQTTAELFVIRGLDPALNIDRESFNFGHPHAKLVRHWVHLAFRQLATTKKKVAGEARGQQRREIRSRELVAIDGVLTDKLGKVRVTEPPAVVVCGPDLDIGAERKRGTLAYGEQDLLQSVKPLQGPGAHEAKPIRLRQLEALAALLAAYGAFDNMDFARQQELLNGIARIVWGSE